MKGLIAAFLAIASSSVNAEDWIWLGVGPESTGITADAESIRQKGALTLVSVTRRQQKQKAAPNGGAYIKTVERWALNCKDESVGETQVGYYHRDGTPTHVEKTERNSTSTIAPGSPAEWVFRFGCDKKYRTLKIAQWRADTAKLAAELEEDE